MGREQGGNRKTVGGQAGRGAAWRDRLAGRQCDVTVSPSELVGQTVCRWSLVGETLSIRETAEVTRAV